MVIAKQVSSGRSTDVEGERKSREILSRKYKRDLRTALQRTTLRKVSFPFRGAGFFESWRADGLCARFAFAFQIRHSVINRDRIVTHSETDSLRKVHRSSSDAASRFGIGQSLIGRGGKQKSRVAQFFFEILPQLSKHLGRIIHLANARNLSYTIVFCKHYCELVESCDNHHRGQQARKRMCYIQINLKYEKINARIRNENRPVIPHFIIRWHVVDTELLFVEDSPRKKHDQVKVGIPKKEIGENESLTWLSSDWLTEVVSLGMIIRLSSRHTYLLNCLWRQRGFRSFIAIDERTNDFLPSRARWASVSFKWPDFASKSKAFATQHSRWVHTSVSALMSIDSRLG